MALYKITLSSDLTGPGLADLNRANFSHWFKSRLKSNDFFVQEFNQFGRRLATVGLIFVHLGQYWHLANQDKLLWSCILLGSSAACSRFMAPILLYLHNFCLTSVALYILPNPCHLLHRLLSVVPLYYLLAQKYRKSDLNKKNLI